MDLTKLAVYAGPIALAAFAGVFLGGLCLSFFWKNFGPWQLLEACKVECQACQDQRIKDANLRAEKDAEIADIRAQLNILQSALEKSGLKLMVGSRNHHTSHED